MPAKPPGGPGATLERADGSELGAPYMKHASCGRSSRGSVVIGL